MPILELAQLRLRPQSLADISAGSEGQSSSLPTSELSQSFIETWTRACSVASSASGIPFRLYRSTDHRDEVWFIGGWTTSEEHIAFLSGSAVKELTKAIGQWTELLCVSHIAAEIGTIGWTELGANSSNLPSLVLREWTVRSPEPGECGFEKVWTAQTGSASGWDLSSEVQGKREEFKEISEAIGKENGGALHVHGVEQQQNERQRFALSVVGHGEVQSELGMEGIREVRREVLSYVLG